MILGNHARHELQELADVAVLHVAERVGREDIFQIGRVALLVDRDGGGIGLALGGDGEGVEFHDATLAVAGGAREIEILHGRLAGGEIERDRLGVEARVEHVEHDLARRHLRQAIDAGLIGEHLEAGAADGDAGVVKKLAGDDVLHAAGDGGGCAGGSCRNCRRSGQREDAGEKGERVLRFHWFIRV